MSLLPVFWLLRLSSRGRGDENARNLGTLEPFRAPKKHRSKNQDRDIPYKPLIKKPNKVGISV